MHFRKEANLDKKEILKILKENAIKYNENLKDNNLLILYQKEQKIEYIEILFLARNFMHLTGVKYYDKFGRYMKANQFFQACLKNKLSEKNIKIKKDGTTQLKLQILSQLIHIDKKSKMIGIYNQSNRKLTTEILLGNIHMCLGLIKSTGNYYLPNSLMKEDIRKRVIKPYKIVGILKKNTKEEKYQKTIYLNEKIEKNKIQQNIKIIKVK